MNCGDFRYLIQRRFDIELSPPDDRALLIHLETCESCQKFYHQVQQVIIAAEELDLPEELLPPRPEFLANQIAESIPQSKPGFASFLSGMSGFLSRFGLGHHVTQSAPSGFDTSVLAPLRSPGPDYQGKGIPQLEQNAQITSIGPSAEQIEEQRVTRSLGQKFGLPGNTLTNLESMSSQPLTLAESIRQKIAEMSKSTESTETAIMQPEVQGQIPSDTDMLGEWTIPHSPEWTKINSDLHPDEWSAASNVVRAPNNWGETAAGWAQPAPVKPPVVSPPAPNSPVLGTPPDTVISGMPAIPASAFTAPTEHVDELEIPPSSSAPTKMPAWSIEAEQLETGNWQAVHFETALSSAPPALPGRPSEIPTFTAPNLAQPVEEVKAIVSPPSPKDENEWELSIQEKLARQKEKEAIVSSTLPEPVSAPVAPTLVSTAPTPVPIAPTPVPIAPTSAPPASVTSQSASSALFSFDDHAIDKLFSENLGVHEKLPTQTATPEQQPIEPAALFSPAAHEEPAVAPIPIFAPEAAPQIQTPTPPVTAAPEAILPPAPNPAPATVPVEASGLFTLDDNMIDRIFSDNLGIPEQSNKNIASSVSQEIVKPEAISAPSPSIGPAPFIEPEPVPAQAEDSIIMDPDKLANSVLGKQKIIGIGRLDTRSDLTTETGTGRIASVGKFLLDNNDLEKIGKLTNTDVAESKVRALTSEANSELKTLLKHIDSQQGVIGSIIFGHDGLLIANTMPQDIDAESCGVSSLAIFMGTSHVTEKLGNNGVKQIVSKTDRGYLIIANFGAGLLITLTNQLLIEKLLPLMRIITQLVAN